MLSGEATNTNFIVFGATRPGIEPTIYRTRGEHANHYAPDAVPMAMGFTYDFYANRWRMCSISYYFRNSSASINNVTNVNYDIDLQKMYMYSCKMPQMVCLTR